MILALKILLISQIVSIIDDIKVLSTVTVGTLHGLVIHGTNFKSVRIIRSVKEASENLEKVFGTRSNLISSVIKVINFLILAVYAILSSLYIDDINFTYISAVLVANAYLYQSECNKARVQNYDSFYSVPISLEAFDSLIRLVHISTLVYFMIVKNL